MFHIVFVDMHVCRSRLNRVCVCVCQVLHVETGMVKFNVRVYMYRIHNQFKRLSILLFIIQFRLTDQKKTEQKTSTKECSYNKLTMPH